MPSPFTSVICFREEPPSRAKEAKKQRKKRSPERKTRASRHACTLACTSMPAGTWRELRVSPKWRLRMKVRKNKLGTQFYGEINILKPLKLHL